MPNLFGSGSGTFTDKQYAQIEAIAKRHDVSFISTTLPGDAPRFWFEGPDLGSPFNGATKADVFADLADAGITLPGFDREGVRS